MKEHLRMAGTLSKRYFYAFYHCKWQFSLSDDNIKYTEAVVQRCSAEKVFLEISQNSQENPCARASFSIKLQA